MPSANSSFADGVREDSDIGVGAAGQRVEHLRDPPSLECVNPNWPQGVGLGSRGESGHSPHRRPDVRPTRCAAQADHGGGARGQGYRRLQDEHGKGVDSSRRRRPPGPGAVPAHPGPARDRPGRPRERLAGYAQLVPYLERAPKGCREALAWAPAPRARACREDQNGPGGSRRRTAPAPALRFTRSEQPRQAPGNRVHADVAQLVAHHLAKVRVAGSNPVVRSEELLFAASSFSSAPRNPARALWGSRAAETPGPPGARGTRERQRQTAVDRRGGVSGAIRDAATPRFATRQLSGVNSIRGSGAWTNGRWSEDDQCPWASSGHSWCSARFSACTWRSAPWPSPSSSTSQILRRTATAWGTHGVRCRSRVSDLPGRRVGVNANRGRDDHG
jgi:hypothetical protein